ncbi:hypothetical protein OIY81_3144 [Cryptosporidium canis]|nr:hypothetical protein OIY81_3144 [Cryptosporidium canis]
MEGDLLIDKTIRCIAITLNPSGASAGDERFQAECFLDEIPNREDLRADELVLELLRSTRSKRRSGQIAEELQQGVEFVGLAILDKFVTRRWTTLKDEDRSRVRNRLLEISTSGMDCLEDDMALVTSFIAIRKLCCTFSRVIIQDYFASWKAFLESILECRSKLMNLNRPGMVVPGAGGALRARNTSILTRLALGITKEISETLLINSSTNELNSRMKAASKNGLCNEIEPVLHIISSELRSACSFPEESLDLSLVKQSLDCLKNLAKIIDSGKLLNLRLDDLLIALHSTRILDSDEEILDLLDSLVQNLTKQKKGAAVFILDYEDLNRFTLGVSNLVKSTILNPALFSEDPEYDTSLMHLNWMKLFKDLVEGCTPALLRIPSSAALEKSINKLETITFLWNTALVLCMHPYISVCDLSVSSLCLILKILSKELPSLSKEIPNSHLLIKEFRTDVLLVFLLVRSLRIGDPKINYLTEEWSPWNAMISNMIFNSLTKLSTGPSNAQAYFPSQPFNFSLIASKYFKLLDEYNIADSSLIWGAGDLEVSENATIPRNSNPGSFNNSYSSLRNRVIQLLNLLVDFGDGVILDQLLETCLNIAMFIFSTNSFNSKCTKHSAQGGSFSSSPQTMCQKWIFIDGIYLIIETTLSRINSNIQDILENEPNQDHPSASCESLDKSSFLDILSQNTSFKEQKVWIVSLFKLLNGILQLSLLEQCGNFLESRRLVFVSQIPMCIEWFRDLFKDVDSLLTLDGVLHTYLFYLSNSTGPRAPDLRRTAANCLSRILLNYPKLFEPKLAMVIQAINQSLNDLNTCFDEKTALNSVLIAATNAIGDFDRISESCEITSKAAFSLLPRDVFGLTNQEVMEFFFRDLIDAVKASKEPNESYWRNLTLFKNSLTLLFSVFANVKVPEELSSLKNGGFLKEQGSFLVLKHPLEGISRRTFETICLITSCFLHICDYGNPHNSEDLNIISLFNSISDQEWMTRSATKNLSEPQIIQLSKITNCRIPTLHNNCFTQVRRLTSSIRNLLIKLLVSIFTVGTCKDLPQDPNNIPILNPGLYFEERNVHILIKTLIDPIRTLPIHIISLIIKNGWSVILSPETLPRLQSGHPSIVFLEEVFSSRFVPVIIEKLRSEWQNLMASHAFMLSSSICESASPNHEHLTADTALKDPANVLLNVSLDFKDFPGDPRNSSLFGLIYSSHYNDLSEISLNILRMVGKFILSSNRQVNSSFKLRSGPKCVDQPFKLRSVTNNEDLQMDHFDDHQHAMNDQEYPEEVQMSQKTKIQPRHAVLSQNILLNQNLMRSCLEILVEFLGLPDPNVLETSLHIIQRYLQQYINFTGQANHENYSQVHTILIKNLLIQLLKVGPRAIPFDPLNLSPSKNENIKITTPLNSYIKLNHPNMLKSSIVDCIQAIIRSDPDCLHFINSVKNELSKNFNNNATGRNMSHSPLNTYLPDQQMMIPDGILEKAYNCLEFLFSKHFEYLPSGSDGILSQQDIIFICKTFLQEHILDILSPPSSVLSNLIGNILHRIGQISLQNEKNPYINFNTFIKPSFQ